MPISDLKDAQAGDLVLAEPSGRPPRVTARVDAILGDPFAPRSFSLIAIHKYRPARRIPDRGDRRGQACRRCRSSARTARTSPICRSSRSIPRMRATMTTRSGPARATTATAGTRSSPSPTSAIYVRPGSELDREARARGNSVYFPDRVVPMLPHELSSDICSLKQGEVRAAMACHLHVGKDGALKSWRFSRAKICVAANIAYEDAQAAMDAAGEESAELASVALLDAASCEGPVPNGAGRQGAEAAVGLLARAARRAQQARAARARPARAPRGARREGPHPVGRAARAARRAPAGRGLYDRRQRRRGQGAREEEGAGDVPRP